MDGGSFTAGTECLHETGNVSMFFIMFVSNDCIKTDDICNWVNFFPSYYVW